MMVLVRYKNNSVAFNTTITLDDVQTKGSLLGGLCLGTYMCVNTELLSSPADVDNRDEKKVTFTLTHTNLLYSFL